MVFYTVGSLFSAITPKIQTVDQKLLKNSFVE